MIRAVGFVMAIVFAVLPSRVQALAAEDRPPAIVIVLRPAPEPFDFQLEGDGAILSASYPPGASAPHTPQYTIRYELQLSR